MVATLARLRLRLLRNTLAREKWRIILLVLGGLYALGLIATAVIGSAVLGASADAELRWLILVLAGSALVVGWLVLPVLVFGMDDTLDPQRFALLVTPSRRFALGLLVAGAVSIPGVATVLASLGISLAWLGSGSGGARVTGFAVALLGGVLGALMCLLLARLGTTAAAGLLRGRRARDLVGTLGVLGILFVSFLPGLLQGAQFSRETFRGIAQVAAWTPFGAPWSLPQDVVSGSWGIAAARLGIVLVTLGAGYLAYARLLARSMTSMGGSGATASGHSSRLPFAHRVLAWTRGERHVAGLPLTRGTAAVAGRAVRYWRGDPRYLASLGSVAVMAVMPLFVSFVITRSEDSVAGPAVLGWAVLFLGPIVAGFGSWTLHNDIAYDSSAFWLHVATGVGGREDRLGRILALAVWLVPLVVVLAVVPPVALGRGEYVPAVLGMCLALLGAGFGTSSVLSAQMPYPAPPPGANPMSTRSGGAGLAMIVQLVAFVVMTVLVLPVLLTLIPVLAASPQWGWLTLALGAAMGGLWLVIGVRRGGAVYERRAVADLAAIRSWPTH